MFYPKLAVPSEVRKTLQVFQGLNRGRRIGEGEMQGEENLSSHRYPLLSPRKSRTALATGQHLRGLGWLNGPVYVTGDHIVIHGTTHPLVIGGQDEITILSMGSYLLFFHLGTFLSPSYINTADPTDYGLVDNKIGFSTAEVNLTMELCSRDGTLYTAKPQEEAPQSPTGGSLWLDNSDGLTLKRWDSGLGVWNPVPETYVKLSAIGIHNGFSKGDGVTLEGLKLPYGASIQPNCTLVDVGKNFIIVPGILPQTTVQTSDVVCVSRVCPQLDFVVEAGNRLWGCRYGPSEEDGSLVNEIYACALGDFKNWNKFEGLSTDSYAASRGSQGPWTGAITYMGRPTFFKENCMETVYPSSNGAHQISVTGCRGPVPGSLAVCQEILYYCTGREVVAYDGSYPKTVSQALGPISCTKAMAGALGEKLYLALSDGLYVLDTSLGLWHREDSPNICHFAGDTNTLIFSTKDSIYQVEAGQDPVSWWAESGDLELSTPERQFLRRILLRLRVNLGAWADVLVSYDDEEQWHPVGHVEGDGSLTTRQVAIFPRRCDHLRLRLEGYGPVEVYTLTKIYEKGSDTP